MKSILLESKTETHINNIYKKCDELSASTVFHTEIKLTSGQTQLSLSPKIRRTEDSFALSFYRLASKK